MFKVIGILNMFMNKKLVVLSGANGGIGSNILSALISNNYEVFALDISDSNIKNFDCHFVKCDLTNHDDVDRVYKEIEGVGIPLYAVINTVGTFQMQSLIEGNEEALRKSIEINFFSIYHLNKILFPLLEKDSRIINLTSEVARYSPQPFQAYYNLSKILLDSYTDALRREANYLGIKVIKIQSGSMKTTMLSKADNEFHSMADSSEHFKSKLHKMKFMMDKELKKQNDPSIISKTILKILKKKKPRIVYRIKNSKSLSFMGRLPESWQDDIYMKVIK